MENFKNKSPDEIIEYLEKMLEELLNSRPELKMFQTQIDQIKNQAGNNPEKRIKAMNEFFSKFIKEELLPEINRISDVNKDIKDQIENLQKQKTPPLLSSPQALSPPFHTLSCTPLPTAGLTPN